MRVLAITHAQLNSEGLSPISCERADSFVYFWVKNLGWDVNVIYSKHTKWRGPWELGLGLSSKTIVVDPKFLKFQNGFFSDLAYDYLSSLSLWRFLHLLGDRIYARASVWASLQPLNFVLARRWGNVIAKKVCINNYDFIFVSVGSGDEYLLETAVTLSSKLKRPIVIDFRDLFSEHHDTRRFTNEQRAKFKKYERRVFDKTILISTPQAQDVEILRTYANPKVIHVPHASFHMPEWEEGIQAPDQFVISYAGKLYADSDGYKLFLDFVKEVNCKFGGRVVFNVYTDYVDQLNSDLLKRRLSYVNCYHWQKPGDAWKALRRSQLILIYNSSVGFGRTLLPTKSFTSAATGNPILFLFTYLDRAVEDFITEYKCGVQVQSVYDAVAFLEVQLLNKLNLNHVNDKIPSREMVSTEYGACIAEVLTS